MQTSPRLKGATRVVFIGYGFLSLAHFLFSYVWIGTGRTYSTTNLTPWLVVTFGAVWINGIICRAILRGHIPSPPQEIWEGREFLLPLCRTLVIIPLALFVVNLLAQICLATVFLFSKSAQPFDGVEALIIELPFVLLILTSSLIIAHGLVGAKSLLSDRMICLFERLEGFPFKKLGKAQNSRKIDNKLGWTSRKGDKNESLITSHIPPTTKTEK